MLMLYLCFLSLFISVCESNFENVRTQIFEEDLSGECSTQYKNVNQAQLRTMIDSSSKLIPSGVLSGNLIDLGFFDECLSVSDEKKNIYGKYCLASISLNHLVPKHDFSEINFALNRTKNKLLDLSKSKLGNTSLSASLPFSFMFGFCVPDKCSTKMIGNNLPIKIDAESCYTKFSNTKLETSAIIALVVLGTIIVIAIISTVYEIIIEIYDRRPIHDICIAFSLYSNSKKLLKTSTSSEQLTCLNGIKTFSMMWVILGHTYFNFILSAPVNNLLYVNDWIDDPFNMIVMSATLSVDTFFTMGGMLAVYVYMKSSEMKLKESFMKIPLLYVHRYLRLTPALGILVLIYGSGLIKYISDGPKWFVLDSMVDKCAEGWWSTLLYFQNYRSRTDLCVEQSWYLSVDFQLYLFTPFILIPLRKWPKFVVPFLYVLTLVGMFIPFYIGYSNKISGVGMGSVDPTFSNDYYFKTHARFATYVIGMIAGYYIYKIKRRSNPLVLSSRTVCLLWALTISGHLICIYDGFGLVKHSENEWWDGLYMGLNRSAWSIFVCLLIFLCCTGHGGFFNEFLSLPVFQILAKLSYSMYLIHYIVIVIIYASSRTAYHMSNFLNVSQFFTNFVITLVLSVLYTLIFESPMITIEKIILPNRRKEDKSKGEIGKV